MIWKDIIGYEGYYQVSDSGAIRSLPRIVYCNSVPTRKPGIIMPGWVQGLQGEDYRFVKLSMFGISKSLLVHRIVANHFCDNLNGYRFVNHKDKDRLNNSSKNLEWCTHRENMTHAFLGRKSTSKYTGVSWSHEKQKWGAYIAINGKSTFLGRFKNEEDASLAYRSALISLSETNRYAI